MRITRTLAATAATAAMFLLAAPSANAAPVLPDADVSPASILQLTGPGGLVSQMLLTFKIPFESTF